VSDHPEFTKERGDQMLADIAGHCSREDLQAVVDKTPSAIIKMCLVVVRGRFPYAKLTYRAKPTQQRVYTVKCVLRDDEREIVETLTMDWSDVQDDVELGELLYETTYAFTRLAADLEHILAGLGSREPRI